MLLPASLTLQKFYTSLDLNTEGGESTHFLGSLSGPSECPDKQENGGDCVKAEEKASVCLSHSFTLYVQNEVLDSYFIYCPLCIYFIHNIYHLSKWGISCLQHETQHLVFFFSQSLTHQLMLLALSLKHM